MYNYYDYSYNYSNPYATLRTLTIVGIVLAVIATIVIAIMIMPKKKRLELKGFLLVLHNIVNFNTLTIEKILKVLYTLFSCAYIFVGFFWIFTGFIPFWTCLLMMILGPILSRLIFEGLLLLVLGVQNIIEINRKMDKRTGTADAAPDAPAAPAAPRMVFCTHCGTKYDASVGPCPTCGNVNLP